MFAVASPLFFGGGGSSASLLVYEPEVIIGNLIARRGDIGSFENGLATNSFKCCRTCAECCEVEIVFSGKVVRRAQLLNKG